MTTTTTTTGPSADRATLSEEQRDTLFHEMSRLQQIRHSTEPPRTVSAH